MRVAFLVVAIVTAASGCGFKSVTREDRVAASIAASKMKHGTVLTDAQVELLDKDKTYQCQRERRVGTNIPKLTCRTLRRVATDEAQVKALLVKMSTTPAGGGEGSAGGGGGGGGGGE